MNWKGLLCDHGSIKVSIGRVFLWLTFIIISIFWIKEIFEGKQIDAPASLVNVFWSLLVYNVFEKGRSVFSQTIAAKKEKE